MTAPIAAPDRRSLPHPLVSVLIVFVVMALMAGCAGPSAERATSRPTAFAGDLAGTWQGSFWWLGGYYYEDEGTVLLQIEEDGIFTVAMSHRRREQCREGVELVRHREPERSACRVPCREGIVAGVVVARPLR